MCTDGDFVCACGNTLGIICRRKYMNLLCFCKLLALVSEDVYNLCISEKKYMHFLFCLLFIPACALGFESFGGSCYNFSTAKLTWQAAQSACEALTPTSHLVVINDSPEEEWVFDKVGDGKNIWMGCSDNSVNNIWVCEDMSGMFWRSMSETLPKAIVNRGYWGSAPSK